MTGPAEDVRQRVRSYLLGQAEAKGFAELRPAVEEARAALIAEVEPLSEAQAAFQPPGEGEAGWSVRDVLRHVIFEEEDVTRLILQLAAGHPGPGTIIGRLREREGASLEALLHDLKEARRRLLATVEALAGSERLDATAPHPWFGELNCRAWFLFQRVHDGDHTRQVQAIKQAPGFPAA
ncbi:MAG TPA: DinB family protein [Dehalococcoidia bacterium]|nr:DinB family protein [Dehalococcoidia bacterium]